MNSTDKIISNHFLYRHAIIGLPQTNKFNTHKKGNDMRTNGNTFKWEEIDVADRSWKSNYSHLVVSSSDFEEEELTKPRKPYKEKVRPSPPTIERSYDDVREGFDAIIAEYQRTKDKTLLKDFTEDELHLLIETLVPFEGCITVKACMSSNLSQYIETEFKRESEIDISAIIAWRRYSRRRMRHNLFR